MTTTVPRLRTSLLVWGVAAGSYVVAVANRSSLGIAGLQARDRLGVSASTLAVLAVAQLVVYAALQVPVGIALDRRGPRALVATGAFVMAGGQLLMAVASSPGPAVVARMLVGAGDAMTFVSVLRLVPAWFAPQHTPRVTQLTGIVGQLGQVVSAVPFAAGLHAFGWTPAFAALAAAGTAAGAGVVIAVRDAPGPRFPDTMHLRPAPGVLRAVLGEPGAWLGFWVHALSQYGVNVVVLLWGYSFFVEGEGLTAAETSGLFTLNVVANVVAGLTLGELTARRPARRTRTVLAVSVVTAAAWAAVLAPSGPRPLWVLAVFVVVLAAGGPASLVGFDVARSTVPAERLGAATGVVNTGGFVTALTTMLAIGLILDAVAGTGPRDLDAYRVAMSFVAVPWLLGVVGVLSSRRRTRAAHPGLLL